MVRTYRGREMAAILAKIKEELGESAVILTTKRASSDGLIEIDVESGVRHSSPIEPHAAPLPRGERRDAARALHELLLRQGLREQFAKKVVDGADLSLDSLDKAAAAGLSPLLTFDSALHRDRKAVALVGSTGVGKTTTIAKLAARIKASFDLEIGLISADSYRVGAGYHLQTYASLLNLPFRMVDETASLADGISEAVESLHHCDLILVDTAGYSPRDSNRVHGLCSELSGLRWLEKILVLPAPSNDVDLRTASSAFAQMGCNRVIISKTDETGFMGPAINVVLSMGKPLAFLTTGQRVPEDIEPASARRIAWMLTRSLH